MQKLIPTVAILLSSAVMARGDELPTISTLAELRAQSPTHLQTGWDVRVGIADPGKDAGPFILIYADVQSKSPTELPHNRDPHEWLGPLFVRTQWDDVRAEVQQVKAERKISDGLYAIAIPTRKGTCQITVDDGIKTLWEEKKTFSEVSPSPWQPFVGLSEIKVPAVHASDQSWAVIPKFLGDQPLLALGDFAAKQSDADALFNKSLPLVMPLQPDWLPPVLGIKAGTPPLLLALDHDQFILVATGRQMLDWPDKILLARWWVNDKATFPEIGDYKLNEMLRKISETGTFNVAFSYPESLHAKAGDVLALQILYNPNGYEQVVNGPSTPSREAIDIVRNPAMPMLSNRLEFKLTKDLLAARNKFLTTRDNSSARSP